LFVIIERSYQRFTKYRADSKSFQARRPLCADVGRVKDHGAIGHSFCDAQAYTIAIKVNNSGTFIKIICTISRKLEKDVAAGH
jgi:hypothetical protein